MATRKPQRPVLIPEVQVPGRFRRPDPATHSPPRPWPGPRPSPQPTPKPSEPARPAEKTPKS